MGLGSPLDFAVHLHGTLQSIHIHDQKHKGDIVLINSAWQFIKQKMIYISKLRKKLIPYISKQTHVVQVSCAVAVFLVPPQDFAVHPLYLHTKANVQEQTAVTY